MAPHLTCLLFLLLTSSLFLPSQATVYTPAAFFSLMKSSLSGNALSSWVSSGENSYCNYSGISCNGHGHVAKLEISGWSLSGSFPSDVCLYLPELRVLDVSLNHIHGKFPESIVNCSQLQVLNMSSLYLTGKLPDFSPMKSLKKMDLSFNKFEGDFPMSITNLTAIEVLNFNQNDEFNRWELPGNISQLKNLKQLVLTVCNLSGSIPPSIGDMVSLTDLELSGNHITGKIPTEIGKLKNLKQLMLWYNQLTGKIPEELGNLTGLADIDMSANQLTGEIPEKICRLPALHTLQLYSNRLTGGIPAALGESTTLAYVSLYNNSLSGTVPRDLGRLSPLILLDLSENQLSGNLPPFICTAGKLLYFLVLDNMFSGEIPESYAKCRSLLRFRVSYNRLNGPVPEKLYSLPHASIIDLGFNGFTGSIPKAIGDSKNLSELFLQGNRFSGSLPAEISGAVNLVKVDLSGNFLSGPLPAQIGFLRKLNLLLLQGNRFNSSIPKSLSSLRSLNFLDLSNNQFTGSIPESLSVLLPNSINFSYNQLSGPIPSAFLKSKQEENFLGNPHLCVTVDLSSSDARFPQCPKASDRKRVNAFWVTLGGLLLVVLMGIFLCLKRCLGVGKGAIGQDKTLSSSSIGAYDIKSFYQISSDQHEILDAMVEKNILGHGGSGTVYRIGLRSGEVVAVKKLWCQRTKEFASDGQVVPKKELETEVETLGGIRHNNIVKLYSYFSSWDCHLLVYEYMQNGNLWDALHKRKSLLDWPTRHQIALGVARGLAYLHHDLLPPVIHRDIKSSNILLDVNYQPKVADFGVAKVLQARGEKDSNFTVIAGTYGYLDPDYVNSSKATTKCDVYSFGVVLMELLAGKKPVEVEFGESKNIINWIASKVKTKEGAIEVLDKHIPGSFKDEMLSVLRIAIRCTARAPIPRPTMKDVVQLLIEAGRGRFSSFKSMVIVEDSPNNTKSNKRNVISDTR